MNIPNIILEYGFDFDWNEEDVWKLNYKEEYIDIDELSWHFEVPFWDSEKEYDTRPIDVINNAEKYKDHYDRIMKCDLVYPIDIMENKGRYVILDGLHRLVKHKLLNHDKVNVRIIPRSEIKNISI